MKIHFSDRVLTMRKCQGLLVTCRSPTEGGVELQLYPFLVSALMGVNSRDSLIHG